MTWAEYAVNVPNVLTITTTDYTSVDYDGKYTVTHRNGKSEGSFELLICAVKEPANMFQPGQILPLTKVIQDPSPLTISIERYTVTDQDCGQVTYSAKTK